MYEAGEGRYDLDYSDRVMNWARRSQGGSYAGVHGSLDSLTRWGGESDPHGRGYRPRYKYGDPRDDYYRRKSRELSSYVKESRGHHVDRYRRTKSHPSSDKDLGYSSDSSAQRRGGRGPYTAEGWGRKGRYHRAGTGRRVKSAGHTPNSTPDLSPPGTPVSPATDSARLDMIRENVEAAPESNGNVWREGSAKSEPTKSEANSQNSAKSEGDSSANKLETSMIPNNVTAAPVANGSAVVNGNAGMRRNVSTTSMQSVTSERKVLTVTINSEHLSSKRRCRRACRKWPFFKYLCIVMFVLLLGFIIFSIIATVTGRWGFSTNNEDDLGSAANSSTVTGS